jgi:hypothetical protein
MAICRQDIEGHALNAKSDEKRGADMADTPKLQLARPYRNGRIDLPLIEMS